MKKQLTAATLAAKLLPRSTRTIALALVLLPLAIVAGALRAVHYLVYCLLGGHENDY